MGNLKMLVSSALVLNLSFNLVADENVEVLKKFANAFNKVIHQGKVKEERAYNYSKSKMEDLIGEWKFTYTVDGKTYKDEVTLEKVTLDSSMGYMATGTNKPINTSMKQPIGCFYFDNYYEYLCLTMLSNSYVIGYGFDKSGNYLYGAYGIADNPEDLGYQVGLGVVDLYGVRQASTTSTTSSTSSYSYDSTTTNNSSDNIYVTDLKNKTHTIGWYFWMSDSGKAYLASSKYGENGDISVWNFTNDRKWRPIYNASAFDGYASAKDTFSNVYFSTDKRTITFGTSLLTNEFTTDLANKTHSVGWYFWMSDSNKAYLANGRDNSKGVAIWNFTDERKWRPVHNTDAFDGYEKADKVFSSVNISSDGTSITTK